MRTFLKTKLVPMAVLLLMIIVASVLSPVFLSKANIDNLFIQASTTMIISMAMLMVILTGGIDLSVGSVMAVSGVLVAGLMKTMPVGVAVVIGILAGLIFGIVNGVIVAKFHIAPFIVTLGMQNFARGCAYWYCKSQPISWNLFDGADTMYQLGSGKICGISILILIWIAIALITFIILQYTVWGRIVYSIGGNIRAVQLSGIRVDVWQMLPYIFAGVCSGIAGVLLTARLGVGAPTSGANMETDAIAAVIVGGTSFNGGVGTVSGAVMGVFIMTIIGNILDLMNVGAYPQMMLKGVILVAAVILSTIREKKN